MNQNSVNYIFNEDFQNYIDSFSTFVKADSGYYFVTDLKLYFYDTESNQAYPVCSKANCEHQGSECTAYLSPLKFYVGMRLCYYDHALYILGYEQDKSVRHNYMYQISLENFKIKKAAYLFDSSGQVSTMFMIHRGYVYFVNGESPMKESTAALYRTMLGNLNNEAPEKIYEFSGIGANLYGLSAYGNNLFFMTASYENEAGDGYNSVLNYMDIHTLKANQIPEREFSHLADGDRVYYGKDETTIEYYNLNTQETAFFCNIEGPVYISADSNYIYFDNLSAMRLNEQSAGRKIYVYDKQGNYITEIVPKNPRDECYFGGDDIMIFEEIDMLGEVVQTKGAQDYYVLDKAQLTSPDKQFTNMQ